MNKLTKRKKLREFGLIIGLGFPIIIGWIIPSLNSHNFMIWTLWVGIPSILIGLIAPQLLNLPYKFWIKIGDSLGWFNSHIILGVVFLLVLLPIAFIMKMFGYDPLRMRHKEIKSYKEYCKEKKIDLNKIF